jgi:hypothetical protein
VRIARGDERVGGARGWASRDVDESGLCDGDLVGVLNVSFWGAKCGGAVDASHSNSLRAVSMPTYRNSSIFSIHSPPTSFPFPHPRTSQGMMLRVDQLQKKRLLMRIMLEASLKNRIASDQYRRVTEHLEVLEEDTGDRDGNGGGREFKGRKRDL